jgi:membrane fusion protein, multidrug efflux system
MAKGNSATSRGRRIILIATCLAAFAAGGAGYWYWGQGSAGAQAARTAVRAGVPVTVAIVQRQDVPIYLSGLGTVQASFTVGIHSQVDGKLQEVLFTEGQQVKKGDVLAKIDPRLFQAALDQAKAKKAQDVAQFISASKDLERSNTLVKSNITSQQIVDQQQGKVDQLRAMIDADEAMIQTAQTNLDYTTITAPSDGRMGVRLVDPGNIVHANDQGSIATLVLTRPSAVLFTLPARALDDIRAAMARGPVEVTAFDQDNRYALATGTLLVTTPSTKPPRPSGSRRCSPTRTTSCGPASSSTHGCCSKLAATPSSFPRPPYNVGRTVFLFGPSLPTVGRSRAPFRAVRQLAT